MSLTFPILGSVQLVTYYNTQKDWLNVNPFLNTGHLIGLEIL
jgi:hypothetical protein